ncbi:hypothetical protein [Luteimonas sp. MC1825]|uniref:hypothetical protein n=1 Tax=Luteimonas sp. MC1825 TaxID=2761107 RepID=UPI00161C47EE|nr:hypothetical protein [Luteimonas sp. MC1825]MBB6600624.1 hypothetical protein [Luteimonas sp. MC1825]QOC88236.1 hypothetical protein IDM46_00175 [Luteimonas sp. MC1825]
MSDHLLAYLPLGISLLSLVVAAFSLGWNIYRDIILKPRVRVTASRSFVFGTRRDPQEKFIISAVNFGPGKVNLNIIWFKRRSLLLRLRRKQTQGVWMHDFYNPLSAKLPAVLEVGEKIDLIFPWDKELIFSHSPTHLGLNDSFGRLHCADRKEVRKVLKVWQSEFGRSEA